MTNCIKCEKVLTAKEVTFNNNVKRPMMCYGCAMAAKKEAEKPTILEFTTKATPELQKIRSMALAYAKDINVVMTDMSLEDLKDLTKIFAKYTR